MTNSKNILVAERYANALLELGKEGKLSYTKITQDLNLVKSTLESSKDLGTFLTNPLTGIEDKKEILKKVFSSEIDNLIMNFLFILIDKRRFEFFNEILVSYATLIDDVNNVSRVSVISAVEMSTDAKNKLKDKLESKLKKNIVFDWEINSDVIAGLIIKIGDNVIDMSLRHKLEDLGRVISK